MIKCYIGGHRGIWAERDIYYISCLIFTGPWEIYHITTA